MIKIKKSIDEPVTADPGEDSITEDSKRSSKNPIKKKPKEVTITVTPIENSINEDPHEL